MPPRCSVTAQEAASYVRGLCPSCGGRGSAVKRTTLKALLQPRALGRLERVDYKFCLNPSCPVVYFSQLSVYRKEDLKVRVGLKETENPVPVCYCFGYTEESIWDEIRRTGRSTAAQTIAAHVKAGRCGCEMNNPAGSCCLGEVNRVVNEGIARFPAVGAEASARVSMTVPDECCSAGSAGSCKGAL